jgi:hypothetical protein
MAPTQELDMLDLSSNPFTSPTKSVRAEHISRWASELTERSPSSPVFQPSKSQKNKRPGLRMYVDAFFVRAPVSRAPTRDLSNIPSFDYGGSRPSTASLMNAPRIGCEASPSPSRMDFGPMTPRPGLVSRFSDESTTSGSSSSSCGANTPPLQSPAGLLPSPAKLALPNLNAQPVMTPRTVDALDCVRPFASRLREDTDPSSSLASVRPRRPA